jgi:hypothetical protein
MMPALGAGGRRFKSGRSHSNLIKGEFTKIFSRGKKQAFWIY